MNPAACIDAIIRIRTYLLAHDKAKSNASRQPYHSPYRLLTSSRNAIDRIEWSRT